MDKLHEIRQELQAAISAPKLTREGVKLIGELYTAELAIKALEGKDAPAAQISAEPTEELTDIFPALDVYKKEHSAANLQRLCTEILEFCTAIYASTENPQERAIYFNMVEKMKK